MNDGELVDGVLLRPFTLPVPVRIGETVHAAGERVMLAADEIERVQAVAAATAPLVATDGGEG